MRLSTSATISAVALSAVVVRLSLLIVRVRGNSMLPTMKQGDRVLSISPRIRRPRRGDIIVFHPWETVSDARGQLWVKRLVALAGDPTDQYCCQGRPWGPVPTGYAFVLGDGTESQDSRHLGFIPVEEIRGVVMTGFFLASVKD